MPVYQNTSEASAVLPGYGVAVAAGDFVSTKKYVYPLPAAFELITHGESPVKKLHAAALPVAIASGLAKYGAVTVDNNTDAIITGYFNGSDNSDDTWVVLSGAFKSFEYDKSVEALTISGSGTGNVYVNGVEKD